MMVFIRNAKFEDSPEILLMLNELQAYEHFQPSKITLQMLQKNGGFSSEFPEKHFRSLIAEDETSGAICGYALYYFAWMSAKGKVLFLEELYVREKYRGQKVGADLMREV